jgi:hypothetical protein
VVVKNGLTVDTNIPNNAVTVNIEGLQSESVFWRPLAIVMAKADVGSEIQAVADAVVAKTEGLSDDRALVLVCALLVENAVFEFLSAAMPNDRELGTFSFAAQIRIAKALRLCPPRFFRLADSIRLVRNAFAHQLSVDTFSKLPAASTVAPIRQELSKIDHQLGTNVEDRQVFKQAVTWVVVALRIYAKHVRVLNTFLRSEKLIPALKDFAEKTII